MTFERFKRALGRLTSVFARVDDTDPETLESLLLQADVGVKYTRMIVERIRHETNKRAALRSEISRLLTVEAPQASRGAPLVIALSGVNGSGKTTTAAKLAHRYGGSGSVLLVSADTYRDAASQQLAVWADRTGVEVIRSIPGQDAAAVTYDALNKAMTRPYDTVIIDTAGRLHTRVDLLEELSKIHRVIAKFKPAGAEMNLLTIDATTGQNAIQQARVFAAQVRVNGLVLTKFDGTAKGGAIIPIVNELGLPVRFLGLGEGLEDLVDFDPAQFAAAILD